MVYQVTAAQIRHIRLTAQGLIPQAAYADVATAVSATCGIQSQELPSAALALRARISGLTLDDVKKAREIERSIVLTWAMRGTMHLVSGKDLDWMLALFGSRFIRQSERRYKQLDLDEATRRNALKLIPGILKKNGALNRVDLGQALASHGIPVAGQAIYHLVRYAALKGILCFGPERDGELICVVLEDWLARKIQQLTEEIILPKLALCYLQACAPATPDDLAGWAGISVSQAKAAFKAISDKLVEVENDNGAAWLLQNQWNQFTDGDAGTKSSVRFLPRYDTYLLGHRSRNFMVHDEFAHHIHPGGGLIRPCVIVDGQAQAIWRIEHKKDMSRIIVAPFQQLDPAIMPLLEADAQDIGRFLNRNVRLIIEAPVS